MNINEMNLEQVNSRLEEIRGLVQKDAPGTDYTALDKEARQLLARKHALEDDARSAQEKRQGISQMIASGVAGTPIPGNGGIHTPGRRDEARTYDAASPEYRTAWLKDVAVRDGIHLFGDMTPEERTAFTHTTQNSGAVVPTVILNKIIELVDSSSPMLEDATPYNMASGFGVPRHKGINAGDASATVEGAAPADDEENEFDLLGLDGVEVKKVVAMTRKMKWKSIDAFESWLVTELSARIAVGKEKVILARLDNTAPASGIAVAGAGIDSGNILTAQTYDDATVRTIFSMLHGKGVRVVYANTTTIWKKLAGIENAKGEKLFIPNTMSDPTTSGNMYGALVKPDDNLADNVIYFGIKGQVLKNDFEDLFIHRAIEPRTLKEIITGYSLFDAGLADPKSFVKATFTP